MKLERFDVVVWSVVSLIALALGAVLWIGDRAGVRIVGVRPESNETISAKGAVVIEFAQPMNRASVESGFRIDPEIEGRYFWQANTLTFAPSEPFARNVTYMATVIKGVLAESGQAVKADVAWRFTAREPQVVYIAPASEAHELWVKDLEGEPRALTATNGGIYDFAVAPDGESIAYTVVNESGGSDVWLMNRDGSTQWVVVECASDRCTAPDWSPDGRRIAYSRESAGIAPGAPNGPPRVWIFDRMSGASSPLYQDSQLLGYGPSWSPDGKRLAAWDGSVGSIRVVELNTGDTLLLKSQSGVVGAWSPDGETMLFNDLSFVSEQPYVKLYAADFATKEVRPAFDDERQVVDYSVPVWSPDGLWLAAGLKTAASGLGSQLWIMRPDGSEARVVAGDPQYTYGAYRWSLWSDALIFQRFALGVPFARPEILMWSIEDGSIRVIAEDASLPAWLP